MPRATFDTSITQRFDLKSLPASGSEEVGWVELRKLTYGQILQRRDMAAKIAIEGLGDKRSDDLKVTTDLIQKAVTEYEYKNCIADHNLEDGQGVKLNFGDAINVQNLDPQVGQEISDLIDKLNDWDTNAQGKGAQTSERELEPA